MAKYGKLKLRSESSETDYYPKTFSNLVYMKGESSSTIHDKYTKIISGEEVVGKSKTSDTADTSKNSEAVNGMKIAVKESGYKPSPGDFTNTIVFVKE